MKTWALVLAGVTTSVLTLLLARQVLVHLPADHFRADRPVRGSSMQRWGVRLLGVLAIALGVVLALPGVPGQGLLLVLMGLVLMDLPVLRRLELKLLGMPRVLAQINRMRTRAGQPPLNLP